MKTGYLHSMKAIGLEVKDLVGTDSFAYWVGKRCAGMNTILLYS